ncbi:4Fe-4S binding protein [Sunxiuqinia sp. A32]|uniref:4Fe-4S binding protein n=1 Tax=Sunxiuqinia sp. A32 TaxID=3461496 RepID=UPI0040460F06
MTQKTCILFCRCGANVISIEKTDQLAEVFHQVDADVYELKDLCALSINEKDVLQSIGEKYDKKIIVACYPRAIKNMFRQAGVQMGEFDVLNFKELSVSQIKEEIETVHHIKEGEARYQVQVSELDVPAWFPVIDESRCTLCGQCARFCLFGVYSYNKKSLTVVNPLACKNNCPACGRTCPTSAIMFPRLAENSVLEGAEPGEKGAAQRGKKDGLFVMLNERNQNRKNIFKQGVVQMAEEERRKALEEFKKSIQKKK